jgi:hypothetical protein
MASSAAVISFGLKEQCEGKVYHKEQRPFTRLGSKPRACPLGIQIELRPSS